jgi:hypothetical protein
MRHQPERPASAGGLAGWRNSVRRFETLLDAFEASLVVVEALAHDSHVTVD